MTSVIKNISPEEQLWCLALNRAKKVVERNRDKLEKLELIDHKLEKRELIDVTDSVARSILNRSHLLNEHDRQRIASLRDLAVERLIVPRPLPSNMTNWYKALQRIDALPESIPPLPDNIDQSLASNCPIRSEELKPDGTTYKVGDTHSLYLIPAGTINELRDLCYNYGQRAMTYAFFDREISFNDQGGVFFEDHYFNETPLKFAYFMPVASEQYGNVHFDAEWVLISNDILEGSRDIRYEQQVRLVERLSTKAGVEYEVPSLKNAVAAIFLHKVATGKNLYRRGCYGWNEDTYTCVKEMIFNHNLNDNCHLVVGSFSPFGIRIYDLIDKGKYYGVGVIRKFR